MTAARVLKEHDQRKAEILEAAQVLFNERGYESTSVNGIIHRAGISKGTFYHYFDSKEELLDSLATSVTDRIMQLVREATKAPDMDALTKLNTFFGLAARWKSENIEVILALAKGMYAEGNLLLRHKMSQRMVGAVVAEMAGYIRQGIDEGVFDTPNPEDAAELIMQLFAAMRESTAPLFLSLEEDPGAWSVIERKLKFLELATERILGAAEKSICFIGTRSLRDFRRYVAGKKGGAQ